MELFSVFVFVVVSFCVGVITTIVLQYYLLYYYFKKSPIAEKQKEPLRSCILYSLPDSLKKQLTESDLNNSDEKESSKSSCLPINLIVQFLFHELRHSEGVKHWLHRKLSLEFEELLTKTTMGRFFDAITIKDMHLGSQFPDIKEIRMESVKMDKTGVYIENLDVSLNLNYTGNFVLSVDGRMKFNRTAYLSIKVRKISGIARLQFTRDPYTHWSFAFYQEPILDLGVESHFQGRQLQAHITNLIVHQIKRAINRKHTLPNYKIRYKPFFTKTDPSQLEMEYNNGDYTLPCGQLDLSCLQITRLALPSTVEKVFCTFTIDDIPWVCLQDEMTQITLEVTLVKVRQGHLGVIFKQDSAAIVVTSVATNSPAQKAGLKIGDVVLAVENKPVANVPQMAKMIRLLSNITLYIQRATDRYQFATTPSSENDDSSTTNILLHKRNGPNNKTVVNTEKWTVHQSQEVDVFEVQSILHFEQDFRFVLQDNGRYLNINVWGKNPNNSNVLLGYTNIPLNHVLGQCSNTVLGNYMRTYPFLPPVYPNAQSQTTHPLSGHSGFEQVFCYGDILLSFKWTEQPDSERCQKSQVDELSLDDSRQFINNNPHDFLRTQFHSTTHCDFCTKKIWLKDAVKCRHCNMCCHRKCIQKCQLSTNCAYAHTPTSIMNDRNSNKSLPLIDIGEDLSMNDDNNDDSTTINNNNNNNSMKRVNSVNNLAPPISRLTPVINPTINSTRSLPPSPARKPSITTDDVTNPFTKCPEALNDLFRSSCSEGGGGSVIETLLVQIMVCGGDEKLMDMAKETGQQYYGGMGQEEKVDKVNLMVSELKKVLDIVTVEHLELTRRIQSEDCAVERAKLAFLIGQADAKVNGLSALMLHYCSSLQIQQAKIV